MRGISKDSRNYDLLQILEKEIKVSDLPPFMRTSPDYIKKIIQEAGLSIIERDGSHFIKEDDFKQALNGNYDYLGFMPYSE